MAVNPMKRFFGPAGLGMVLLVGACAPATEYTRPNMTVAQRNADEKACLDRAQSQALDESFSSHPLYPPSGGNNSATWKALLLKIFP